MSNTYKWTRFAFRTVVNLLIFFTVVIVLAASVVPKLLGMIPLTVLTGSMEPTLSPGDQIIVQKVDGKDIKVGNVITFQPESDNPDLVTHRVVGRRIEKGESQLITRGDANGANDNPIVEAQVQGRYVYHLPKVGYLAEEVREHKKPLLIAFGVLFVVYFFEDDVKRYRDKRKAKREQKEPEEDNDHPSTEESIE